MDLNFDLSVAANYHSGAQRARVITEKWVADNMYCPRCGRPHLNHFRNNKPVADFYCPDCRSEYELKSKNGSIGRKINDGAYDTMIHRITSNKNPDFFFMSYSKDAECVTNFMLIPKHFFVPAIIEKRKPLADTAKRAGWVGCNILIDEIPKQGRVSIVSNGAVIESAKVISDVSKGMALKLNNIDARGWLFDVLICINQLKKECFSIEDMYMYEKQLFLKHPQNRNIKPKIRQQLQLLRDKGFVEFLGNGHYRKVV